MSLRWMKQPDPNPGLIASAEAAQQVGQAQVDLAREEFEWNKEQYEDLFPFIQSIYQSQADIAEDSNARAREFFDYWKSNYKPVEDAVTKSAMDYNTENRRELMAQKAAGDIASTYEGMRGQLGRQLSKYGINPSSDRFATLNASLMRDEALQKAGAMTKARDQAEAIGFARQMDVAGLGRGMVGAGQGNYGIALQAGNSAVANSQVPIRQMNQGFAGAQAGYGGASSSYGTAMRGYGMDFDARMMGYQSDLGLIGDFTKAAGYAAGFKWADGGEVRGPGGPKEDKIPALLSDGEYVVPASVVKKVGVGHFDKMIEKHGDEGNKQALAARRGIKRRS